MNTEEYLSTLALSWTAVVVLYTVNITSIKKTLLKPLNGVHGFCRLHINADLCRTLGSLITELATPDVLYNNRFWPEEESLKMTVER
ncbi:hypothetical protein DPMN_037154 [Dreissena polymorpha]|uniref:Uncharacterized protein n=1 Tax=Dreissena polymorpha TaxID=45954 RepID=A0A9D4RNU5_DREPO|nr:hypothetical protein DPMN_037154 [Dreissena polymorpha]